MRNPTKPITIDEETETTFVGTEILAIVELFFFVRDLYDLNPRIEHERERKKEEKGRKSEFAR